MSMHIIDLWLGSDRIISFSCTTPCDLTRQTHLFALKYSRRLETELKRTFTLKCRQTRRVLEVTLEQVPDGLARLCLAH